MCSNLIVSIPNQFCYEFVCKYNASILFSTVKIQYKKKLSTAIPVDPTPADAKIYVHIFF